MLASIEFSIHTLNMTNSTESPSPIIHQELSDLIDSYLVAESEPDKRKLDWEIRVKAEASSNLEDNLKYQLVTYGPEEGLSPERSRSIDVLKRKVGELFLIPIGKHTYDYGFFGRIDSLRLVTGWSLYAFDDIPDDQPALVSEVSVASRAVLKFGNNLTSFYGDSGPFYHLSTKPKVEKFALPIQSRQAIIPHPVPYEQDEEGIVFTEPLNYFDDGPDHRSRCSFGECRLQMLVGEEAIKGWFDVFTKGEVFRAYSDLLVEAESQTLAA